MSVQDGRIVKDLDADAYREVTFEMEKVTVEDVVRLLEEVSGGEGFTTGERHDDYIEGKTYLNEILKDLSSGPYWAHVTKKVNAGDFEDLYEQEDLNVSIKGWMDTDDPRVRENVYGLGKMLNEHCDYDLGVYETERVPVGSSPGMPVAD